MLKTGHNKARFALVLICALSAAVFAITATSATKNVLEHAMNVCVAPLDRSTTFERRVSEVYAHADVLIGQGWMLLDPENSNHLDVFHNIADANRHFALAANEAENLGSIFDMEPHVYWEALKGETPPDSVLKNIEPLPEHGRSRWLLSPDNDVVLRLDPPSDLGCLIYAIEPAVDSFAIEGMNPLGYLGLPAGSYDYRYDNSVSYEGGIQSALKIDSAALETLLRRELTSVWTLEVARTLRSSK